MLHVQASEAQISLEITHCLVRQLVWRHELEPQDLETMIASLRQTSRAWPTSSAGSAADTLTTWLLEFGDHSYDHQKKE